MRMNTLKLISALLFAFSFKAFSCVLVNPIRHVNPDGTQGGLVSRGAKVESSVHIGFNARVCDRAWVDGNAQILDYAVVKEDAWVREYSNIKDRATVGGSSVIRGTRNTPVYISEDSNVYGGARILTGTRISGRAEVFGGVSIQDSNITGTAKVCESYMISYQDINDDYFCASEETPSRTTVSISGYKVDSFNKKSNRIRLSSSNYNFSRDSNVFQVFINGNQVEPSKIFSQGKLLNIEDETFQVEGLNKIQLVGRDEYGKKIQSEELEFIVGTSSKTINISHEVGVIEEAMSFKVAYTYQDKSYGGSASFRNGMLRLDGLPSNMGDFEVSISGFGESTLIAENFASLSEIPETIYTYTMPKFINNNLAFTDGLVSWKKSHPDLVRTSVENGKTIIEVDALESERIEISKRIKFSDYRAGLNLNLLMPQLSKLFINEPARVKLVFASLKNKFIEVQEFDLFQTANLNKNVTIKNEVWDGEYFVMIRIEPSLAMKNSFSTLKLLSMAFPDVIVEFYPYNFSPKNSGSTSSISKTTGDYSCSDSTFNLATNGSIRIAEKEDVKYFSVGPAWDMINILSENRIHGWLRVSGKKKENVENITLVGVQDDIIKFEVPLSKCAGVKFAALGANDQVSFPISNNLVGHLFSVPLNTPNSINVNPGSKISLYAKAKILKGNTSFLSISNETETQVLVAAQVAESRWYSKVDLYDSSEAGMLRTGGDKWILPAYAQMVRNILIAAGNWNINDLSKLNGGNFPGHSSHDSGRDADLRFDPTSTKFFNFSLFPESTTTPQVTLWQNALSEIETFFNTVSSNFNVVETIFITREQSAEYHDPNFSSAFTKQFILNKFQSRCLTTHKKRYVDFYESPHEKSLLSHALDHWNHIHIRFNEPEGNGLARIIEPVSPTLDLDSLWFRFNEDDKLVIEPITPSNFTDTAILWRFQPEENFDNLNMETQFGRWKKGVISLQQTSEKNLNTNDPVIRYIHVTFANTQNGGCIQRSVAVDMGDKKRASRWTYKKSGYLKYQHVKL